MRYFNIVIARTDAEAANLITSDIDPRDQRFIVEGKRAPEGFYYVKNGIRSKVLIEVCLMHLMLI
jgi:isocitrate lyase